MIEVRRILPPNANYSNSRLTIKVLKKEKHKYTITKLQVDIYEIVKFQKRYVSLAECIVFCLRKERG